jgi:hypothetical protein
MLNTFIIRLLTVFSGIGGIVAFNLIGDFPRLGFSAIMLAIAGTGFFVNTAYLFYVQSK